MPACCDIKLTVSGGLYLLGINWSLCIAILLCILCLWISWWKVLASVTRWNILKNTHDGLRTPAHQHQLFVSSSGFSPLAFAPSSEATEPACSVAAKVGAENRTQKDSQAVRSFCLLKGRALCLAADWEHFPKICCSCQGIVTGLKERKESETEEEQGAREHRQRETSVDKTQKTTEIAGVKFSAILCSEGTYRQEAFEPLANVLEKFLHTHGVALVASKRWVRAVFARLQQHVLSSVNVLCARG